MRLRVFALKFLYEAACLSLMVGLKLTEVQKHLLSGFVDIYLPLNEAEKEKFVQELGKIQPEKRKKAMEIVTSWQREGMEMGLKKGVKLGQQMGQQKEATKLLLLMLRQRVGRLPADITQQLECLPVGKVEKLFLKGLNFSTLDELREWLKKEV